MHKGNCKVVVSQNGSSNSHVLTVTGYGDKLPKNEQALRHAIKEYAGVLGIRTEQLSYERDADKLVIYGIPASLVPAICSPHRKHISEVDFSQLHDGTTRYRMHKLFEHEKVLVHA